MKKRRNYKTNSAYVIRLKSETYALQLSLFFYGNCLAVIYMPFMLISYYDIPTDIFLYTSIIKLTRYVTENQNHEYINSTSKICNVWNWISNYFWVDVCFSCCYNLPLTRFCINPSFYFYPTKIYNFNLEVCPTQS